MDDHPKGTIAVIGLFIAGVGLVALLLMGSQVSTILSKVGASVSNGGGTPDATDSDPLAYPPPATPAGGTTAKPAAGGADAAARAPVLLIIRTGTLTLETPSITDVVSAASGLVTDRGGFVAGSKESGAADAASATVDYRIPAARWEETLTSLRRLATVRDQQIKTDEVTGTVVDLGARISNLRATEAALQAIMAKAVKIEDVLDVQSQLTETRGQIEELSAQKASLEDRAAFGSLTVIVQLPPSPRPSPTVAPTPVWDPGKDVEAATGKLIRISQRATSAGIWVAIVGLPILVVLAVGIAVLWLGWRFVGRRRGATPARAG